jgi:hypothetical protein
MTDASDIGQAISAANAPLVKSVEKLEQQIQRMAERLDQLPTVYMARAEYEPRHLELRSRVEALEIRMADEHRWSISEHARMSDLFEKDLDGVRQERQNSRGHSLTVWVAAGGWLFGVASLVLQHFWK